MRIMIDVRPGRDGVDEDRLPEHIAHMLLADEQLSDLDFTVSVERPAWFRELCKELDVLTPDSLWEHIKNMDEPAARRAVRGMRNSPTYACFFKARITEGIKRLQKRPKWFDDWCHLFYAVDVERLWTWVKDMREDDAIELLRKVRNSPKFNLLFKYVPRPIGEVRKTDADDLDSPELQEIRNHIKAAEAFVVNGDHTEMEEEVAKLKEPFADCPKMTLGERRDHGSIQLPKAGPNDKNPWDTVTGTMGPGGPDTPNAFASRTGAEHLKASQEFASKRRRQLREVPSIEDRVVDLERRLSNLEAQNARFGE